MTLTTSILVNLEVCLFQFSEELESGLALKYSLISTLKERVNERRETLKTNFVLINDAMKDLISSRVALKKY